MIISIDSPFKQPAKADVMCLILDRSFDPELLSQLFQGEEQSRPTCIPLFTSTPYADLQPAGPYVVMYPEKQSAGTFAETLLEQADAGCIAWLSNSSSLDQGVEHWQSLLTVRTDEEPLQMMRFFDPRWLEPLLLSLSELEKAQFIGPFSGLAWRNEIGWRYYAKTPQSPAPIIQPPAWLYLSPERQVLIEHNRLKVIATRFADDYRDVLPPKDTVEFVHRQLLAGQNMGYEQMVDQERWLRLAITHGDNFWTHSPSAELLARDDIALGDKLTQLESL
ncbi:hypothetical protein BK636_00370 [Pseudomonas chlororaphis]|uniref:DUF4123 domain-containing protein n=1 Tax=Pseudomonas chlororaphis TaxID=587753 RepID=UPI000F4802FD|nr:DUF4123 domain-containing protein [Pseudomonas chlororaphis]ROL96171.1 hypothetical protein BK636_00370 [Pseudomonas chlororaphis]